MDKNRDESFSLSNGEVRLWLEQGQSVCIKAITATNDPVELSAEEAQELGRALIKFAQMADK